MKLTNIALTAILSTRTFENITVGEVLDEYGMFCNLTHNIERDICVEDHMIKIK